MKKENIYISFLSILLFINQLHRYIDLIVVISQKSIFKYKLNKQIKLHLPYTLQSQTLFIAFINTFLRKQNPLSVLFITNQHLSVDNCNSIKGLGIILINETKFSVNLLHKDRINSIMIKEYQITGKAIFEFDQKMSKTQLCNLKAFIWNNRQVFRQQHWNLAWHKVNTFIKAFQNIKQAQCTHLNMYDNCKIPTSIFKPFFSAMENLLITRNCISSLQFLSYIDAPNLREIDLSFNYITKCQGFSKMHLPSLNKIFLYGNKFKFMQVGRIAIRNPSDQRHNFFEFENRTKGNQSQKIIIYDFSFYFKMEESNYGQILRKLNLMMKDQVSFNAYRIWQRKITEDLQKRKYRFNNRFNRNWRNNRLDWGIQQ